MKETKQNQERTLKAKILVLKRKSYLPMENKE